MASGTVKIPRTSAYELIGRITGTSDSVVIPDGCSEALLDVRNAVEATTFGSQIAVFAEPAQIYYITHSSGGSVFLTETINYNQSTRTFTTSGLNTNFRVLVFAR